MQPEQRKTQSNQKKYYLCIKNATQLKSPYQLFNYEHMGIEFSKTKFPINVTQIGLYYNIKNQQKTLQAFDQPPSDKSKRKYILVAKIFPKIDPKQKALNINIEGVTEFPGLVVRTVKNLKNQQLGHILSPGEVIRWGRLRYLVREIKIGNKKKTYEKQIPEYLEKYRKMALLTKEEQIERDKALNEQIAQNQSEEDEKQNAKQQKVYPSFNPEIQNMGNRQRACRICLDDVETSDNFIVTPCQCKGSCRYIHFLCLKEWVDMKMKIDIREHCIHFRKMQCEICKSEFPLFIQRNGKDFSLIKFERPKDVNYIMLQKIDCLRNKDVLILKRMPQEGIYIGRDAVNYIKFDKNNISVSRCHAYIKQKDGSFLVFDNKSTFGTVIEKDNFEFKLTKPDRGVQFGKHYCSFSLKKQ